MVVGLASRGAVLWLCRISKGGLRKTSEGGEVQRDDNKGGAQMFTFTDFKKLYRQTRDGRSWPTKISLTGTII